MVSNLESATISRVSNDFCVFFAKKHKTRGTLDVTIKKHVFLTLEKTVIGVYFNMDFVFLDIT